MNFNKKLKWGKLLWCLFLFIYFFFFFKNLFLSSLSYNQWLPIIFFIVLSYWMIIEYYFSSPFFQSGIYEYHKVLRTLYSLYFYPFLIFISVDYCYKNLSQINFLKPVINIFGLLIFLIGTALRLITLFLALNSSSLNNLTQKPIYKKIRQPRYLATLIQLIGIAFTFSSFIGLLLLPIGILIIIAEARYEDKFLKKYYKDKKSFLLIPKII
uniref:Isoprenylcysteine carboxylmethyltransferase family protein n=1 Tax=candidate division WOR-3 bacterium TaxID=2052148 RepID=A0A7V5Y0K4_UNCW3